MQNGEFDPDMFDNQQQWDDLREEAAGIILGQVLPAYTELVDFLRDDYGPNLRPAPGIWSVPNGVALYHACLEMYTSIKGVTAMAVHKKGIDNVERIRKEVAKIGVRLGKEDLAMAELFEYAKAMPDQTFETKEDFLEVDRILVKFSLLSLPKLLNEELTECSMSCDSIEYELHDLQTSWVNCTDDDSSCQVTRA